jgi:predicted RNase H-like HicB family nuclease
MKPYLALFEYETGKPGFSAVFPDLPGLLTAGDDYAETLEMAQAGLTAHLDFLLSAGEEPPAPRTIEQIARTWDEWEEWRQNYQFEIVPVAPENESFAPANATRREIMLMAR